MSLLIFWACLFFAALIVMGVIAARHFTELAMFDASSVPQIQEKSVKQELAARRVFRGLQKFGARIIEVMKPARVLWAWLQKWFRARATAIANQARHLEWKQKWQEWRGRSRNERRAFLLTLLEEADEHRRAEQYVDAEKKYVEVVSLDPKNVSAYVGLGKTYFRQERWRESEETFQHVVDVLDGSHELAWAFLGRALKEQGRWDDALAAYRHALKMNDELSRRWADVGQCLRELGKLGEAASAYKKAVHCDPHNPRALDQLIEISIIAGDKRLAREALTNLQSANPENQKLMEWELRVGEME